MEGAADPKSVPSPRPERPTRFAGRWRLVAGVVALLILGPLLWIATKPLATGNKAAFTGTGGPAKGVGPRVDYEAPEFKLADPSGKQVDLNQFRGKPVLLNFWATWCAPCREEMPEIEQVYRQYKDRGLVVLAVSVDDTSSSGKVPDFLKEGSPAVGAYTFPVALDLKQDVLKQYKLLGVPSTFFIDPSGIIRVVEPRAMSRQNIMDGVKAIMPSVS